MYHPTTRLLTILELLQAHGTLSGHELAKALEVEERSVRRYIMQLRDMGIPIEGERGRYGSYTLRAGFRLPPMMFNYDEITALMVGLMLMQNLAIPSATAVTSAITKIERVLPESLQLYTEALQHSLTLQGNNFFTGADALSTETLLKLSTAVYQKQQVIIRYSDKKEQVTERAIDPYGIVHHGVSWYLSAHCHLREDLRLFRLERVQSVQLTSQSFTAPEGFNASEHILHVLSALPDMIQFEVMLETDLETAKTVIPPSMGLIKVTEFQTLMRCYSESADWLARFLLQVEFPFYVIQPPTLRDALKALMREIAENLEGKVPGREAD